MIEFSAAPAVPTDYSRLKVLTEEEISKARILGYIADDADPRLQISRPGVSNDNEPLPRIDLGDWRTRMYIVWFCFIYENILIIQKPFYAIEELILEFKGLGALDSNLASLYAGAGAWEPSSVTFRQNQRERLRPNYIKAVGMLDAWALSQRSSKSDTK